MKIELDREELKLIVKLLNKKIEELDYEKNRLNEKLKCHDLDRVERINLDLYIRELSIYRKILKKIKPV